MTKEERLSDILYEFTNKVYFFIIPLVTDKDNFLNTLVKFTPGLNGNIKIVTINENEKKDHISFNQLAETNEKNNNIFFIIYEYDILTGYAENILNKKTNNRFIILLNIIDLDLNKKILSLQAESEINFLFFHSKNMDLPINFSYNTRKTYIYGDHLKFYLTDYLNNKTNLIDDNQNLAKILNVFFDTKIKSLENLNLDKALQRAPKFKTILLDILTKNKKRHLLKMIDGMYGIDSFVTIYNKLKNVPVLVIIKSSDSYDIKIKKMEIFNESNAPGVLITNYNFSDNLIPKNIDVLHITDGGVYNDLITFFDLCQSKNYSGTYPRNLELISHIVLGLKQEDTIDKLKNDDSFYLYNQIITYYDKSIKNTFPIYLKGNEFYVTNIIN